MLAGRDVLFLLLSPLLCTSAWVLEGVFFLRRKAREGTSKRVREAFDVPHRKDFRMSIVVFDATETQLSATDLLALASMKNAAKCDK